ncbi:MAG: hypothetical protein RDV41_07120 [Planctomycetota bacterium]|nr:hypothetical protein [Planctomycetota bacterium]
MRCKMVVCVLCLLSTAAVLNGQEPTNDKPILDCRKLVLDVATALETKDFEAISRLSGEEFDEDEAAQMKKDLDEFEKSGRLADITGRLRLFPKVGTIPAWADRVDVEIDYLDGNREGEIQIKFELKNNIWIVRDFDADTGKEMSPEELDECTPAISKAPAEGQKTIDAGMPELFKNTLAAMKSKDWNTVRKLFRDARNSSDNELEQDLQKAQERAGGKFFELAAQLPDIGPVPAPIAKFEFCMSGILEGKETEVDIQFDWRAGETMLDDLDVTHQAMEEEPEEK